MKRDYYLIQRLWVYGVLLLALLCMAGIFLAVGRDGRMIRHSSEHIVYYCEKDGVSGAQAISAPLEAAYRHAAACLGSAPGGKIEIIVHSDPQEFYQIRDKAGLGAGGSNHLSFLYRDRVHLAPYTADEAYAREAAYQVVRCMLCKLADRQNNGLLGDAVAAYVAGGKTFAQLKAAAPYAAGLDPAIFTRDMRLESYAAFSALPEADACCLFAVFLSEEGSDFTDKGALWRVIRGRVPTDFARATGYDAAVWAAAWKAWLQNFAPYELADYAEVNS